MQTSALGAFSDLPGHFIVVKFHIRDCACFAVRWRLEASFTFASMSGQLTTGFVAWRFDSRMLLRSDSSSSRLLLLTDRFLIRLYSIEVSLRGPVLAPG